ncbi:MAG: hypothetical protein K5669_01025 [Lachnospiraceae bacterium]|nr:hypothetical protein [Lachnospiraceae bacterium]
MKHSKSSLFLMEMIVCILFFSLSAAVSAQMFAKSHIISETAINENYAVIEVNNMAEAFYSESGDLKAISEKFYSGNSVLGVSNLMVYFDSEFNIVSSESGSASYYVSVVESDNLEKHMKNAKISFYDLKDSSDSVYSLDVSVNMPNTPSDVK